MHIDQYQEWARLAQEYRAKNDDELLELNLDFADLTETAQQVLSAELRSRGLDKKIEEEQLVSVSKRRTPGMPSVSRFFDGAEDSLRGIMHGSSRPELVPDESDDDEASDGQSAEYTWKTVLCECEEDVQARQVAEVLRRAGIQCWIESRARGLAYTRVLVAADELDRARAIIANPIPQDIIDESHETVPDYEAPRCPSCGAEDPILESAEPVNAWKCESCGREWTDPGPDSQRAGSRF